MQKMFNVVVIEDSNNSIRRLINLYISNCEHRYLEKGKWKYLSPESNYFKFFCFPFHFSHAHICFTYL